MTITKAAYRLCKSVVRAEVRRELQERIHNLSIASGPGGGQFGSLASKQGVQLLSFLVIDQERARISAGPLPLALPPLSESDRKLFGSAHAEMTRLDDQCVQPVVSRWPVVRTALFPYSHFPPLAETHRPDASKLLLSEPEAANLVEAFAQHSDMRMILTTPDHVFAQGDENGIHQALLEFLGRIQQGGVGHVPSAIEQLVFHASSSHPQRAVMRFFSALLSVRESLHNLNQMIYQAILADKPPILDEDCIISISDTHNNVVGSSAVIAFQPDAYTHFLGPGDLALVKVIPNHLPLKGLVRVEGLRFEYSRDLGSTHTISTRFLNDDLSPFGPLSKAF